MRNLGFSFLLPVLLLACGDDHGSGTAEVLSVRLDDASEEMMLTIRDRVEQGDLTIDAELAPLLTAPAADVTLPRATAPTFTWSLASGGPRHGIETGDFVWLEITGGGMERDIGVIAIGTTSWTPEGDAWTMLAAATGPVTVKLTGAAGQSGLVSTGPYRADDTGIQVTFEP